MKENAMRSGKSSFNEIYDQSDPRAYMRELKEFAYQTPGQARAVFRFLIDELRDRRGGQLTVADVCCSYGFNAALWNHEVSLEQLYAHYASPEVASLSTQDLAELDREFYASRRRVDAVPVVGLDVARNAVEYAHRVGVLDVGVAENLEEDEPTAGLRRALADVGLFTVTGGISYIADATFDRLLRVSGDETIPWVAAFALRWVDMDRIAMTLEGHGLTLERLEGHTFRQRRFTDDAEREYAFAKLGEVGVDPKGVETDGYYHTWLYVARPSEETKVTSLEELLAPLLSTR